MRRKGLFLKRGLNRSPVSVVLANPEPHLLSNTRQTECGAGQFLTDFAVRAAPFALLRNSRKTERGGRVALRIEGAAAPFAG